MRPVEQGANLNIFNGNIKYSLIFHQILQNYSNSDIVATSVKYLDIVEIHLTLTKGEESETV